MVNSKKIVSILIRTFNEERWITACLRSINQQTYQNFEIIVIDNNSADNTVQKAKDYNAKVISIDKYFPGKAINLGARNSKGEVIVCISGHCIPTNEFWLANLIKDLSQDKVAGVYGRQEPLSFSSDSDKRDLMIAFGLDKRLQIKDSFFHNANSAFRKETWKKFPFDETVTNVEDRIWATKVIESGYQIVYEPEASVYHYHGIHQEGDKERLKGVVRVLEDHNLSPRKSKVESANYEVCVVIPIMGDLPLVSGKSALSYTVEAINKSKFIDYTVVAADSNEAIKDLNVNGSIEYCFQRPPELSETYKTVWDVIKYSINKLKTKNKLPDIVVYASVTNPFRPDGFFDEIIGQLISGHFDRVIPTVKEFRSIWGIHDDNVVRIDEGYFPHDYKSGINVSIFGLGTPSFTDYILRHDLVPDGKIGLLELEDIACTIDMRDKYGKYLADNLLDSWWVDNYK